MAHHLLGLYDSPYVRRVAITLQHYGIAYTHEALSVFRHSDAMRAKNPLLRVPQLTLPDGETLHESAFILDYLDELARAAGGEALIPAGGAGRRAVWQATAVAQLATDKAVAIHYEFRRPADLLWEAWLARLREQLRTAFGQLEAQLGATGDWLVGDRLSHADIMTAVAVSFIRYANPAEWPSSEFVRCEALTARLEASAAFLAVPIEG